MFNRLAEQILQALAEQHVVTGSSRILCSFMVLMTASTLSSTPGHGRPIERLRVRRKQAEGPAEDGSRGSW